MILFIPTIETSGFDLQFPRLGPFPFEDMFRFTVAFIMLIHSLQPGRHLSNYTQFATIRNQRNAYRNAYVSYQEN